MTYATMADHSALAWMAGTRTSDRASNDELYHKQNTKLDQALPSEEESVDQAMRFFLNARQLNDHATYQFVDDDPFEKFVCWFRSRIETLASPSTQSSAHRLHALKEELECLQIMPKDWDGHGAERIAPEACASAFAFLQTLSAGVQDIHVYPEPDGSLGMEWHRNSKVSIYLSFGGDERMAYVVVLRNVDGSEEVHRGAGIHTRAGIPHRIQALMNAAA